MNISNLQQSLILQNRFSTPTPSQGYPPYCGSIHARTRVRTPSPHGREQLDQGDHGVHVPLTERKVLKIMIRPNPDVWRFKVRL